MIVKVANLIAIRRDPIYNQLSSNDICNMFDDFLMEFERMEKGKVITAEIFLDAVEDIVDAVLSLLPYKLLSPRVLYHPVMHFLHQVLITKLNKWCILRLRLNVQEMDILLKTVLIFIHIAEQAPVINTDEDQKRVKDLLTTKQFLFKIREQTDDIFLNKQNFDNDIDICALGLLTIKMLQEYPFHYITIGKNEHLFSDLVMSCLDSYDYIQIIQQLQRGESLTDIDHYILSTCWEYLSSTSSNKRDPLSKITSLDLMYCLSDHLLTLLEQSLDELAPTAPSALTYIFEQCHQLLNIQNLPSFDKHAHFIIDYLTNIVQKPSSTNPDDEALVGIALEAFSNLTKNTDIRTIMKQRQLTSVINKYTSADMGDKRKLAFGILAEIMDEQEINNNPTEMIGTFIQQLKQVNPKKYNPSVDSTLSSLRGLVQYEQVKVEFIKQDGLKILASFVCDGDIKKQSDKQLADALKILASCTFNNPEALNTLKQDAKLMTRVNQVFDSAKQNKNNRLEKAAEGLIWKVEKEEKFKQEQEAEAERKRQKAKESGVEEEENEPYDLMISYSWADKELAHRIFKHLTEKLGYKIWIDEEQMSGSTIDAMANAVESAQFILMCMSETYKKSANCQSEAEYAFSRKKHIVPIKMEKNYTPDGWLGFILGTRMYIDFGKHEFDKAIELLNNEIQLQKNKRKEAKEVAKPEKKVEEDNSNKEDTTEEAESCRDDIEEKISLDNIKSWNETDVKDFLTRKRLSDLLPLCDGLNGMELLDLYAMCKSSSVMMYRFLKFELSKIHDKVLLISTYLRFVRSLRNICNNELQLSAYICTEHLEEHLQDDD